MKQKNGANKRRKVEEKNHRAIIEEEPEEQVDSINSSQNTQEMTTVAPKKKGDGQINFTAYTRAMLDEQAQKSPEDSSLFSKKSLLQISKLRLSLQQSRHL